jgi:hypothetical protein
MSRIKLPYGIKEGELVHVALVKQGANCECICPKCAGALVAAKGEFNADHFRHQDLSNCEGAAEFALRAKIMELLQSSLELTLPVSLDPTNSQLETLVNETTVKIESMAPVSSPDPLTPRFEIKTSGHSEEEIITVIVNLGKKAPKDTDEDKPYIEINLADFDELSEERLKAAVHEQTGCWRWIKRPLAEKKLQEKLHYTRIRTTPEDAERLLARARPVTESGYYKPSWDGAVVQPPKPRDDSGNSLHRQTYNCKACNRKEIPEEGMSRTIPDTGDGFCKNCIAAGHAYNLASWAK